MYKAIARQVVREMVPALIGAAAMYMAANHTALFEQFCKGTY